MRRDRARGALPPAVCLVLRPMDRILQVAPEKAMRPRDLAPIEVLAERKPHGTRLRYLGGCKCVPCRAAASRYETGRAKLRKMGLWNGIVDATRARRRLFWLSRRGIGRYSIARATGISATVICKIRSGERRQCRAMTEKAILELGGNSPPQSMLVPAGRTWARIRWLLAQGFTKGGIAQRLGSRTPALQLRKDFVILRTAKKVEALWRSFK